MAHVAPGNPDVIKIWAGLYGQQEYSDCTVVFMLETSPPGGQAAPAVEPAGAGLDAPPGQRRSASKRRKLAAEQAVSVTITVAGGETSPATTAHADVPEIRIAVRSADEVAAAAAVVKFAYTGLVKAGSITEALQVRQQADYLRMPSRNSSSAEAATELFRCSALYPDPANDPTFAAFAAVLAEAKRRLVAHFGDALAVLNKEVLRIQVLTLPAVGLEALLESDDFGTDSESSVVLMLAEWMDVNYGRTDADTRRRLCGLLRLVQCSRGDLDWILPALALDHYCHPDSLAGWLPITPDQAGWLSKYVGASGAVKAALWEGRAAGGGMPKGWLNDRPRRPCVPPAGLTFTYSASREELLEAFGHLGERQCSSLLPDVDATPNECIWAMGLEWHPKLEYRQGNAKVGMFLIVRVPATLEVESGTVHRLEELRRPTESLQARLYISKCGADGRREDVRICSFASSEVFTFGSGWGNDIALSGAAAPPASVQQQAGEQRPAGEKQQEEQARRAREAAVAAQWAAYLKDDKLTGKVVLLPQEDTNQQ
ncbi:hypothetical protein HXX76_003104 [Chlamydomonas incerta]|uniref:BACK domain-containing protein n=1 Tax=Chlamydomonas incerta TaxID=51695 RepID=A0A835TD47_CHLIN|nr:hypothetical protein HXX76_003104 [Chlamydomonas incerta]|eukprot:KAG2441482.1 hypothetical protein HXX76_003104 [Chlamydomonas incerta]